MRFIDPWGNNVDLSSRGFLGREDKKLPGVRLVAIQVPDVAAAREFYQGHFDPALIGQDADGSVRLSEGTIAIQLTREQSRAKSGIQYFGIEVQRLVPVMDSLCAAGVEFAEESAAQIRLDDPEGNRVVVSEQSWAH